MLENRRAHLYIPVVLFMCVSFIQLSEYPGDVMTISVSPQELILVLPTRRDGEGGPSLLLGDYTCTSEASGESASFTFAGELVPVIPASSGGSCLCLDSGVSSSQLCLLVQSFTHSTGV